MWNLTVQIPNLLTNLLLCTNEFVNKTDNSSLMLNEYNVNSIRVVVEKFPKYTFYIFFVENQLDFFFYSVDYDKILFIKIIS